MTIADDVRRYANEKYIVPARGEGTREVKIRAGDVHDALGLTLQHANVCQALQGPKFQALAKVRHVADAYEGPQSRAGSNSTFHYEIDLSLDQDAESPGRVLELAPGEFQELVREYLEAKGFAGADVDITIRLKV